MPKFALLGVRLNPACTPVPLTEITEVAPCAVVTVMLPETFSALVGPKTTFIVWLCPAPRVTGSEKPLALMSAALTVTWEMVRLEFPLFVSVILFEPEFPAFTLPKLRLVGLADKVTEAATPVPVKDTVAGEFGALLEIATDPERFPAVVGAKTALNVALAPAANVFGVARPLTL